MPNNNKWDQSDIASHVGIATSVFNDITGMMSESELEFRQKILRFLMKRYPNANSSLYECADDWCRQGIQHTAGLVKYYEAYYNNPK
jgi:SH3-like domain-containing protein